MASAAFLREPLGDHGVATAIRVGREARAIHVRDELLVVTLAGGKTIWIPLAMVKLIWP